VTQEKDTAVRAGKPRPTGSLSTRPERVVEAALVLLTKTPYEQIQMREIAESAGVSIATVYRHFASKEVLFAHVLRLWIERFRTRVGGRPLQGSTPEDRLVDAFTRSVRAFERVPEIYSAFPAVEACTDPRVRELYAAMSRDTIATYAQALTGFPPAAAAEIVGFANALLNQNLLSWSRGLIDIGTVYARVERGVRLLVAGSATLGAAEPG
jgi:AcrR family transcriptional regulator